VSLRIDPQIAKTEIGLANLSRRAVDAIFRDGLANRRVVLMLDDVDPHLPRLEEVLAAIVGYFVVTVIVGTELRNMAESPAFKGRARFLRLNPLEASDVTEWLTSQKLPTSLVNTIMRTVARIPTMTALTLILDVASELLQQGTPPPESVEDRLPTISVAGPTEPVVIHDNAAEQHGPFVVTRGSHTLKVPERFRICATPVTNRQFLEFAKDRGYERQDLWSSVPRNTFATFRTHDGTPGPANWSSATSPDLSLDHPVSGVCYYEALAFVGWLERETDPASEFWWCLPTEDMWEFAARGTDGRLFPWGPTFETGRCNSAEAGVGRPTAIGSYPAGRSPFGAEDMAGNVWEFVRADDQKRACALRGGSYTNVQDVVKTSLRLIRVSRSHRAPDFGFRCALEPRHLSSIGSSDPLPSAGFAP
jgi:Sulfatase-modifying factor enzyme 1